MVSSTSVSTNVNFCEPHVCCSENMVEIKKFQYSRVTKTALKNFSREVDTLDGEQNITIILSYLSLALIASEKNSEEHQFAKQNIKKFFNKNTVEGFKFFAQGTWSEASRFCLVNQVNMNTTYHAVTKMSGGAPNIPYMQHQHQTHLFTFIEACEPPFNLVNDFIKNNIGLYTTPAFIKYLFTYDPNCKFKNFPDEWIESFYGVNFRDSHLHLIRD